MAKGKKKAAAAAEAETAPEHVEAVANTDVVEGADPVDVAEPVVAAPVGNMAAADDMPWQAQTESNHANIFTVL